LVGGLVCASAVCGALAPFSEGYRSWLAARGYAPRTISDRRRDLGALSRWLEREGLAVEELTPGRVEEFLAARRKAGCARRSAGGARLALRFLRESGLAPIVPAVTVAEGPLEELLCDYRGYLAGERGLAERTICRYERVARLFLRDHVRGEELALQLLSAADVSGFLARECPKRTVSGARDLVAELRPLLRYLHVAGLISLPLRWAVPGVADLRDRSLPRGLEPATVAKLLRSCDRRRTVGRRDYALLILMVRLGLRVGEVAALRLDDIDWRAGEILVWGKGNREDRLPVPVDVGDALVGYLRRRQTIDCRQVFLRARAPSGPMSAGAIKAVVRGACVRAGVAPVGAHRLRHTAATQMLRAGASLPEIAQVLRHRKLETTAIYAKVDREALRQLARPWPGGAA
jgi:integrase/recombinase XerD